MLRCQCIISGRSWQAERVEPSPAGRRLLRRLRHPCRCPASAAAGRLLDAAKAGLQGRPGQNRSQNRSPNRSQNRATSAPSTLTLTCQVRTHLAAGSPAEGTPGVRHTQGGRRSLLGVLRDSRPHSQAHSWACRKPLEAADSRVIWRARPAARGHASAPTLAVLLAILLLRPGPGAKARAHGEALRLQTSLALSGRCDLLGFCAFVLDNKPLLSAPLQRWLSSSPESSC